MKEVRELASEARRRGASQPCWPRVGKLQLLRDEQIWSVRLPVFELIKNPYDADADGVVVGPELPRAQEPTQPLPPTGKA